MGTSTAPTPRFDLSLYVILDPAACAGRDVVDVAREAVAGGATCLQLRAKQWSDRRRLQCALALARLAASTGVTFIVNDRADIAMAAKAHGVHVGPGDMPAHTLRELWPAAVIGVSTPSVDDALAAQQAGASYLGCGALFDARASKADASAPRGLAWLTELRGAGVVLPIVGIGGIDVSTAPLVVGAGAQGVAVIRAVCAAEDPQQAARALRAAINSGRV